MLPLQLFLDNNSKYIKATQNEIDNRYKEFLTNVDFGSLYKNKSWVVHEIGLCENAIIKIIDLVRKRHLYFHIYHDITELNELKEAALYSFWILKLQPFYWEKQDNDRANYELNAKVALLVFTSGIKLYADKKTKRSKKDGENIIFKPNLDDGDVVQNLYYSFRFRDWSKEALMDLAESLIIKIKPTISNPQENLQNNVQIFRNG